MCGLVYLAACRQAPVPVSPPRTDIALANDTETIETRVPRNATLDRLLRDHAVREDLVIAIVEAARGSFDPRDLRANNTYRLVRTLDGLLRVFEYEIDADKFLRIVSADRRAPSALDVEVIPYEKRTEVAAVRGAIDRDHPSLVAAFEDTGENVQLAIALAEIFAGEVDFESDLQPGDRFELLFEKIYREGSFSGYGHLLAAQLMNEERDLQAYRFTVDGKAGYYDAKGRSLKRFMLASPLRFEPRVTSRFSYRRRHPVHGGYRPHLGVDYGAPYGAAVVAIAGGTVVSAGWSGGSGQMVRIRHASGYESYYLHLSSFGKGIRAGAHVDQGQLIGRVGATGTATGPHLDYRLRRNGVFVNPLAEHKRLPPGAPISAAYSEAFAIARDTARSELSKTLLAFGPPAPVSKPDAVRAAPQ
ncbi:MAG TPA: peptidoglycan DD-metalloendopeptidase family protein [Vicinamibacterales bacterium]|jgi:murein DD-endopeptidase MepM/ murein hydrolase activator NlpD|nr:peptidoglycan DD-metalloendopeptidase family protein [Vicinamibacterales bacterium]